MPAVAGSDAVLEGDARDLNVVAVCHLPFKLEDLLFKRWVSYSLGNHSPKSHLMFS